MGGAPVERSAALAAPASARAPADAKRMRRNMIRLLQKRYVNTLTLQQVTMIAPVFKPLLAFAPRYRAHRGGNATERALIAGNKIGTERFPPLGGTKVAGEIACLQFATRRLPPPWALPRRSAPCSPPLSRK